MEFSEQEMSRRLNAIRSRMDAEDVECLMVSGIENFCYFTGVPAILYQQRRPWCLLIPVAGEPVAFTMAGTGESLLSEGYVQDVVGYSLPVSPNLAQRIIERVRSLGVKTLACELGLEQRIGMPLRDFETVRSALEDVRIVDAADLIWGLRMFKSEEEIGRVRRACRITGETRQELFRSIGAGISEYEIAQMWTKLMGEAGAERPAFVFVNTGSPANFLPSRDKVLKPGDTLWLDGGVYVDGYTCDFSRIATLGEASPRQRQLHGDVVEMMQAVLADVTPGLGVSALTEICAREMVSRGYLEAGAALVAGHGLGMITNEPPLISAWDETVLSEGLLTTIEFGPVDSTGMYIWEEMIYMTRDGYELLTTETVDLVEIEL